MDHALRVGVLHRVARLGEERHAVAKRKPSLVAPGGDGGALDELHHEVGASARREPAIDDAGDAGMLHPREGLPLLREAGDDRLGVHARLHDLDRDLLRERLAADRPPDGAGAAATKERDQLVGTDALARLLRCAGHRRVKP